MPSTQLRFLLTVLAVFLYAAPAMAGPAYRVAAPSSPQEDNWLRREGFSITFQVDEARCKKEYGADWSRQCASAPAGEEGRVVEGVRMTPPVAGVWRWMDDATMEFTPKERLAPDTRYAISLEKMALPGRFSLKRQAVYATQPQAVRVGKETFWIDPSPKGAHAVSVPLRFLWPVAAQDMDGRISIAPSDPKSGLALGEPRLVWNERRDEVVVTAPVTALPENNAAARISIKGLPAFTEASGKCVVAAPKKDAKAPQNVEAMFSITGRARLMDVVKITISPVYDDKLDKKFQLEVKTSLRVLPTELLRKLELIQLPRKLTAEAGKDADWSKMPAVSAEDVKNGTRLKPELMQAADEPADRLLLRIPAESGRGLLAAVDKGLPSTAGPQTAQVRRFIMTVPSLGREVDFLQPGNVLTLSGQKKLDIYATGLTSVVWRAERVRDPFLALAARESGFQTPPTDMDVMSDAVEGRLEVRKEQPGTSAFPVLDLAPLLRGGKEPMHGLMRMELTGYDGDKSVAYASRMLLITDMGLTVKTAGDGARTVFVQHLGTGKPVQGAEVRLLGANGLPLQSAVTNAQGRADLPPANGLEREKRPVAVVALAPAAGKTAEAGKDAAPQDLAWLSLDDAARMVDYSNFAISGRHTSADGLSSSVFSQRGIYLPGETLHFGCIVRRFDWQPMPAGLPLEAVLVSPTGAEVMRRAFTVGDDGLNSFDWSCPVDAPVGSYQLDVRLPGGNARSGASPVLGNARVRVEEFQPDTLALAASFSPAAPKGWIRTGQDAPAVVAQARLDNLYGEPAGNHRVQATLRTEKSRLHFAGFEDYTFYEPAGFEGEGQSQDLPAAFTDSKGIASFALPLGRLQAGTLRGAVQIEGFEPAGGRAVTRQLDALFSPLTMALGYKPEGEVNNLDYIPQNARASLHLLVLNNDLAPVTLSTAEAVFSARRYVNSLVTDSRGEYRYDATPVDTELARTSLDLGAQGLSLPLPTTDAGDFLLTVRQPDGAVLAIIPYTVAGNRLAQPSALSAESLARGDLRLKLEKQQYAPGETIKMRLSTPYAGAGLITIERENVLTQAWFTAQAGESVQEIRIPDDFQGRGYVNVSYARSLDSDVIYMKPHVVAVAPFMSGMDQRDMGLALTAPARALPGDAVTVRLTSRVPGRALIFAVDEGVLQLTGFTTPDPLRDLLGDRALDVETMQIFDLLMPDHARLRGRIPGFGGDMSGPGGRFLNPFKRRGEPPFALWQEIVPVDANGTEVRFTVPQYASGKIRIMAVGSTVPKQGNAQAGRTEASMEVRGTLILKPLLPLAAAPGDEFDGALVVANTVEGSGPGTRIRVSMESASGGLAFVQQPAPQTVAVDENGEATVNFRMRAQDTLGEAAVRFTASLEEPKDVKTGAVKPGADKPVVRTQTVSIRPPVPWLRTETVTPLRGPATVDVQRTLYPYEAKGQASAGAMPVLALRSLLARLNTYPYGCTEQLISRAMPYAALLGAPEARHEVLRNPNLSPETLLKQGNAVVSAALSAIMGNFTQYEGVSLWPGSTANDFVTAYAADFLLTLRDSGTVTPEGLSQHLLDTLESMVGRSPTDIADARVKLYAAWILQRDGRIMTQDLERLEQWLKDNTRGWETDIAAAFLADSFDMLRLRRRAEQRMPATIARCDDSFMSNGAARALHALMVVRHFPEKKKQLRMDDLLDSAFSTDATTVDMGLAARTLLAMGDAAAVKTDSLRLTCQQYAQGFTPAEAPAQPLGGALVLDAPGCTRYRVEMPQGEPLLSLLTTTEGFDRTPMSESASGISLQRRYVDSRGEAVTTAKLGDVITVELAVQAASEISNVVLVDLLPGGFEPVLEKTGQSQPQDGLVRYERREDRGIFFVDLNGDRQTFTYKVRAASRGRFALPAATAEAMYNPAVNARTGGGNVSVE
ncbi:alpha-2-macroglobulin family protein [Desulfovibrio desulfuricans]|uniref:Alpha-2-macroglobulin family protein n=1 Tax=Desulfovibrio desulfuricans TaxID=876 RepID=A0A4P7UFT3_DESDE|nr:MG2 domain-containing protein [Desulfovibrio desulfuricans]QCC84883.1 alpha-2-macroglobulin family protein [Desulfovibrio desulfuricans]